MVDSTFDQSILIPTTCATISADGAAILNSDTLVEIPYAIIKYGKDDPHGTTTCFYRCPAILKAGTELDYLPK